MRSSPLAVSVAEEEDDVQDALVTPLLTTIATTTATETSSSATNNTNNNTSMVGGGQMYHRSSTSSNNNNNNNNTSSSSSMQVETTSPSPSYSNTNSHSLWMYCRRRVGGPLLTLWTGYCPSWMQACVIRLVTQPCAADAVPEIPFHLMLHSGGGTTTAIAFVLVNLALVSLWIPLWCLSWLLTELGLYVLGIAIVFGVGRTILRFLAFPGASRKMTLDMELEFARYLLRMLVTALEALREAAAGVVQAQSTTTTMAGPPQLLPSLCHRAESLRNRVVAVVVQVLQAMEDGPTNTNTSSSSLTPYGNNPIHGDIGSFVDPHIAISAQEQGRLLLQTLSQILTLSDTVLPEAKKQPPSSSQATMASAQELVTACTTALNMCQNVLQPPLIQARSNQSDENDHAAAADEEEALSSNTNTTTTVWGAAQSGLASLVPLLDPPPHASIFGMSVLRGCVLSRYRGARQIWVPRPDGGRIDVLHFPAPNNSSTNPSRGAVLYCNPNAGLMEVSTGLSLVGGNVVASDNKNTNTGEEDTMWVDFYLQQLGLDVYVFNYAGYGRSQGPTGCLASSSSSSSMTLSSRLRRIGVSCVCGFTPRPDTLKSDGIAVAQYILQQQQQQSMRTNHPAGVPVGPLVIHGESIGGMTACGVARHLTTTTTMSSQPPPSVVLVCDRTFCNLEAVAQRLVGDWTAHAIRGLTLARWNTNVAGDFLAASCPKIIAQDAADAIIADEASLKAGIALWKETAATISSGSRSGHSLDASTHSIGWIRETPLRYRMAELENVSVRDTRYVSHETTYTARAVVTAPVWPTDKRVSLEEAFHFAACCKRIGKLATLYKKQGSGGGNYNDMEEAMTDHTAHLVMEAWRYLATCDGLVGFPLGAAVKRGLDSTVAWLCTTVVYGGQRLVVTAQQRMAHTITSTNNGVVVVEPRDFGSTAPRMSEGAPQPPTPIPVVADRLEQIVQESSSGGGDQSQPTGETVVQLHHELQYVASTLRYVQARLLSSVSTETALRERSMQMPRNEHDMDNGQVGSLIRLHCGHNSPFTSDEKAQLKELVQQALENDSPQVGSRMPPVT